MEKPTAYGIYTVSLDTGETERVSTETGTHRVIFSPDAAHYFDTHSALDRPLRTEVYEASGRRLSTLDAQDLAEYKRPAVTSDIFPIKTDKGETLWAMLTRPQVLEQGKRYPVLVYVYGGPDAQVVQDSFSTWNQPWRELMAGRGILVFSVDGRGSGGRGHEFECAVHRRLGEAELEDQLQGVSYLNAQPYVDPRRIGVFGWSYGGYMALNALLRTDGVFKAGVSVAPVTDWHEYDTAYTERYMQRPADNPEGYTETSLLGAASGLTEKLLLVHGLADDNVHFTNSALMVNALVDAGKRFEVMFYPGKSHGINGPKTRADLYDRITRFLQENL
jgi:dipeptidyl-peptidase-4